MLSNTGPSMDQADTDKTGAGGKASILAMAGSIVLVIGVILTAVLGPIGFFFVALGGFAILASPVVWLLILWDNRSDE